MVKRSRYTTRLTEWPCQCALQARVLWQGERPVQSTEVSAGLPRLRFSSSRHKNWWICWCMPLARGTSWSGRKYAGPPEQRKLHWLNLTLEPSVLCSLRADCEINPNHRKAITLNVPRIEQLSHKLMAETWKPYCFIVCNGPINFCSCKSKNLMYFGNVISNSKFGTISPEFSIKHVFFCTYNNKHQTTSYVLKTQPTFELRTLPLNASQLRASVTQKWCFSYEMIVFVRVKTRSLLKNHRRWAGLWQLNTGFTVGNLVCNSSISVIFRKNLVIWWVSLVCRI